MTMATAQRNIKVTQASPFSKPVHAILDGQPVRLTHVGDAEGQSPVYNVVTEDGQSSWRKQADCTIIDPEYLPFGQQALETLSGQRTSPRR